MVTNITGDILTAGIDVDGVLGNFNEPYVRLLRDMHGDRFGDINWDVFPASWSYDADAGYTEAQIDQAWAEIAASPSFWGSQLPLHSDMYNILSTLSRLRHQGHNVYFVTARPGRTAKLQTENWLRSYGMELPTVIVSGNKALYAVDLKMDVYVDDRIENAHDVLWALCEDDPKLTRNFRVYLVDRPYNRVERDPSLIVVPDIKAVLAAEGWK